MKRTIQSFQDFNNIQQVNIYKLFENGELERVKFPFKNSISEGVIFIHDGIMYLIPLQSIKLSKHKLTQEEIKMPSIAVEYEHDEEEEHPSD